MKIEFRQFFQSRESSKTQIQEQTVRIDADRTEINRGGRLAELEMLGRRNAFRALSNLQTSGVNSFAASTHETRNQELLKRGLDPLVSDEAARSGSRQTAWRSISDSINAYYDAEIASVRADRTTPRFEREEIVRDSKPLLVADLERKVHERLA